jgi:hypothetical protein
MRRISTFVLASAVVLLAANTARAQSVSFDTGQPTSPAAGKITATGSYTLAKGDSVVSIWMIAQTVGGGPGVEVKASVDTKGMTFAAAQTGLPKGTYAVSMRMITTATLDTFSASVQVPVAAGQ